MVRIVPGRFREDKNRIDLLFCLKQIETQPFNPIVLEIIQIIKLFLEAHVQRSARRLALAEARSISIGARQKELRIRKWFTKNIEGFFTTPDR